MFTTFHNAKWQGRWPITPRAKVSERSGTFHAFTLIILVAALTSLWLTGAAYGDIRSAGVPPMLGIALAQNVEDGGNVSRSSLEQEHDVPVAALHGQDARAAEGAGETPASHETPDAASLLADLDQARQKGSGGAMMQWLVLATVLGIAPAMAVLVTCFTRIVVVLGLLRQALATQSLPPNSVLFGLALLMTLVVMAPVYQAVHRDAVAPWLADEMDGPTALSAAEVHARGFMIRQIDAQRNVDDVYLFLDADARSRDLTWSDVPTLSLVPAFVISELKTAFVIGFQIYLPFLIIDMLVSSVLISMGMLMLPPVLISLPFKLLLFVLADGWHRVVGTLMTGFA